MKREESEQKGGRGSEIKWLSRGIRLMKQWVDFGNILGVGGKKTQFIIKALTLVAWKHDGINQRNRKEAETK